MSLCTGTETKRVTGNLRCTRVQSDTDDSFLADDTRFAQEELLPEPSLRWRHVLLLRRSNFRSRVHLGPLQQDYDVVLHSLDRQFCPILAPDLRHCALSSPPLAQVQPPDLLAALCSQPLHADQCFPALLRTHKRAASMQRIVIRAVRVLLSGLVREVLCRCALLLIKTIKFSLLKSNHCLLYGVGSYQKTSSTRETAARSE